MSSSGWAFIPLFYGIFLFLVLLTDLLWLFPFLSIRIPKVTLREKLKFKNVVILSDVHLGSGLERVDVLTRILEKIDSEVIVIAGDLLEDARKEVFSKRLLEWLRELSSLGIERFYYVLSESSHDPRIGGPYLNFLVFGIQLHMIRGFLELDLNRRKVYVTHGDVCCRNGFLAWLLEGILKELGVEGGLERILKSKLGLSESLFVMGHTHRFFVSEDGKVVNCGSWKSYPKRPGEGGLAILRGEEFRVLGPFRF